MRLRARELEREAAEVGDLFASVEATLYLAQAELAAGQPTRARRYLRDAMARWPHGEFHFQHWIALRHETFCDLYEGATRDTARRLERGWAAARDARLHEHQVVRGETAVLDANIALALLARGDRDRARWTQRIRDAVERLSQEGRAWTDAWSWLLRAGLASQEGDRDGAISALRKAREGFHAADMAVHAAVVSLRLGELLPGRAGDALVDDAIDRLLSRGVAEPRRWCDVYAPRS
jgi:tetratricopeptide (TPR) repeat protein